MREETTMPRHGFRKLAFVAALMLPLCFAAPASARIVAEIDLSRQTMEVTVDGALYAVWPVSTARKGFHTPTGSFRPTVLRRMWYSRKYDNSPMPYSIFFHHGYAIHGTNYVKRLGRPASHGCVRLHPANAQELFELVQSYGRGATRIRIVP
jgi:lipoprotein-anchoring transpeptidase ErfK/SrfK